jgi:hypothetical protein
MTAWLRNSLDRGMPLQTAALSVVVLAVFGLAGPVGLYVLGPTSLAAAAVAGAICLAGAIVAQTIRHFSKGPQSFTTALLAGMAARMGIPLMFALVIHLQRGPLSEGGFLYYLMVFYPVTLAAEVALSLPRSRQPLPAGRAGTNANVDA